MWYRTHRHGGGVDHCIWDVSKSIGQQMRSNISLQALHRHFNRPRGSIIILYNVLWEKSIGWGEQHPKIINTIRAPDVPLKRQWLCWMLETFSVHVQEELQTSFWSHYKTIKPILLSNSQIALSKGAKVISANHKTVSQGRLSDSATVQLLKYAWSRWNIGIS